MILEVSISREQDEIVESLTELGRYLKSSGYQFICVTPESHRINLRKDLRSGHPLRNLFGWNIPVPRREIPPSVMKWLTKARAYSEQGVKIVSHIRFSTLDQDVLVHSAYPTTSEDSVFFGPDSYRFVRFVRANILDGADLMDIGGGTGVGAICLRDKRQKLLITDVNSDALKFATINAQINEAVIQVCKTDILRDAPPGFCTLIANPPFLMDAQKRSYRDGGANFGTGLSLRIVSEALAYLPPGGQLLLYTATCFVDGRDVFLSKLTELLYNVRFDYFEIDPDIFGEELAGDSYREVERIAAVGLNIIRHRI